MGLISNLDITQDHNFLNRLRGAIVVNAIAVQEEAPDTALHAERARLAAAVFRNLDSYVEIFKMPVVVKGTITNSPSDNAINAAVRDTWNLIAVGGA